MKYTLLDMTQTILSSMDSDEVNSIDDTVESQQVAKIIRTCYYDIISPSDLPEHFGLFNLNATDVSTPTILTKPDTIDFLEWFQYNSITDGGAEDIWEDVEYLQPDEFLRLTRRIDQTDSNSDSFDLTVSGFTTKIYIKTDHAPQYWTSFDDYRVVCNSYDSSVDDFLQTSKNSCFGKILKTFTLEDTFTPDLDDQQFPLLLNEAKALAWAEVKQTSHQKAEKKAREYKTKLERTKKDLPGKDGWSESLPNYGRHR